MGLKKLFDPLQLTTTAVRLYFVPTGKRLDGFELILANIATGERGVDLYLGTTAALSTQLYAQRIHNGLRIGSRTQAAPSIVSSRQVLNAGDGLWAKASHNSNIAVHASGVEIDEVGAIPTKLFTSRLLTTGSATIYPVPAGKICFNFELALCNVSSADATLSSYLAPNGSSGADLNRLTYGLVVAPGETVTFSLRQVLNAGDKIIARSNRPSALAIHGSGYVIDAS